MRKIILSIFLSTTTLVGYSQDVKPDNSLTKDYSSNFLGPWSWENGCEKFRLNLISAKIQLNNDQDRVGKRSGLI